MKPNPEKALRFFSDPDYAAMVVRTNTVRSADRIHRSVTKNCHPPKTVIVQITQLCNRRCKMCDQWGEGGVYLRPDVQAQEMSPEMFKSIYDQVKPYKPNLSYLGGEPLIHRQFQQIFDLTDCQATPLFVETNGTRLPRYAEQFVERGVDAVNVSIDGREEIHDLIRGARGTWSKAIEGVRLLDEYKRKRGVAKPNVVLRYTITRENFDLIEETLDDLRNVPFQHMVVQHLVYTDDSIFNAHCDIVEQKTGHKIWRNDAHPQLYREISARRIVEQIRAIQGRSYPFSVSTNPRYPLDYVETYYSNPRGLPNPPAICNAPWDQLSVDSMGRLIFCANIHLGNLEDGPIIDTWNNALAARFRNVLARRGSLPLCKVCCYPDGG